jgi:hypothetical protein
MKCTVDRCNQGRKPCPTPYLCDTLDAHMADPQPSRWRWLASVLRWILNSPRTTP